MQCVAHCDDPDSTHRKNFEQPVLQTWQMFVGESGCWLVLYLTRLFIKRSGDNGYEFVGDDGKKPLNFKRSFLLAVPAMCDLMGTTILNLGLIYVPVSIYQMVRGSVVLFVAGMSMLFLQRRISRIEWASLIAVTLGVAVVGLSGGHDHQSSDRTSAEIAFGTFLIAFACLFIASQFVVEEFIIGSIRLELLQLVAVEGTFGTLITTTVMVLSHLFYGRTAAGQGGAFDMVNAIHEMFTNDVILYTSVAIMLSIGSFNFFGVSITHVLSATSRSTIDTSRTLLVWLVSLAIGWESFKFLQLLGFIMLVSGTLVFNGAIKLETLIPLPKFLTKDLPNEARVIDAIDEQIEHY